MKTTTFILAFILSTATCVEGHNYYNNLVPISVQTFYDELLPYGDWINTRDYGYVWRPYTENQDEFRPYSSRGNWAYTDLGWTWVSDYQWGWAVFHYGRWYFDDYLGWMWIPGNEWAPAWVTWGEYNDLWAWAPMGPNNHVNVNINWHAPRSWWTFVPRHHFCSSNWHSFIYNRPVQITNITYITNVYYDNNNRHQNGNWFNGPRVRDVERHLNKRVPRMQLVDSDKPSNLVARNNRVNVYRPGLTTERENLRPSAYQTDENLRSERKNRHTTDLRVKHTIEPEMEKRTVTNSREVKPYRTEQKRESVKQTVSRYSNTYQRKNVKRTSDH